MDNRRRFLAMGRTLVVLDDDPTGTQTVFDIPVITTWSGAHIEQAFRAAEPLIFVLTNSRSVTEAEACRMNGEIAAALRAAAARTGRRFSVVSRSDSTLRGHYPAETDRLGAALGIPEAPVLLMPYFDEGGRVTVGDVHYVIEGDDAVPAGNTPFAKDSAFGYQHSNLRDWVEEKTHGRVSAEEVRSVSVPLIREGGPAAVAEIFKSLRPRSVCVVNAVSMGDAEVVAAAVHDVWAEGIPLLVRSAASIIRALAGLGERPLLGRRDIVRNRGGGGLIAVGSHVPKTTLQLDALLASGRAEPVPLPVPAVLGEPAPAIVGCALAIDEHLRSGRNAVLYTSREIVAGRDSAEDLAIGQKVSDAMVGVVDAMRTEPAFVIAKGGITSSDVATKALGIERATVLGQLLPGVPVWRAGEETRFPGLGYVVFPGNVGGESALLEAVTQLSG